MSVWENIDGTIKVLESFPETIEDPSLERAYTLSELREIKETKEKLEEIKTHFLHYWIGEGNICINCRIPMKQDGYYIVSCKIRGCFWKKLWEVFFQ